MKKIKLIAVLTSIAIVTGCSLMGHGIGKPASAQKDSGTYAAEKKTPSPAPTAAPTPTVKPAPALTPVPTAAPVVPTPVPQAEKRPANLVKLKSEALDKLPNTKLSWWISLNKNHQPTTIPADIKNMLVRHNGIYIGDTSKKVVYLTFDEGYENGYTASILDTLKKNNVKSIFFITGPYLDQNSALVKRMLDEGHQVGNHSINHPSLPTVSYSTLENELWGLEKKFSDKLGKGFRYMRPPMGEYSERVLEAANQMGYKTIFWSYAFKDYDVNDQKGADHAYNMVMDNLHSGAVILLHAVSKDNAAALDKIIRDIRSQGYEIRPFDL